MSEFENIDSALEQIGRQIVEAMQNELFENKSVVSGDLARSITHRVKELNDAEVLAISMLWYGELLEDGGPARRAGKFPPPEPIQNWIKRRGIRPKPGVTMDQLVYLISRKIHKSGATYPKNKQFIMPSIDLVMNNGGEKRLEQAGKEDITIQIDAAFKKTGATVK